MEALPAKRMAFSPSTERAPERDASDQSYGASAGSEVVVVAWPALWRRRLATRITSSDRYRWWVLWTVLAGLFSINVTFTLLVVALPRIAGELGTTENTLTWVFTGPLLAFGIAAPTLGKLGDLHGHRRVYLVGAAGAAVAAGLSAVAWNAGTLIAFRVLSSIEGAATGAASMALIFNVFDREDRTKAMGWWSLIGAGGPVIGVAIGGPVVEAFGWRWVFAAQVPLILTAFVLASVVLTETPKGKAARLDWRGAATLALGVTSVLFALNRGPEWGWSSPAVVAGFVFAPVTLAAFVAVERRVADPLLPLDYLRRRNFAFPIAAQSLANFAYFGGFILAPVLLSKVFAYSESKIGLTVIARPLAFSLSAPIAGYLAVRTGERAAAVAGSLAVAASMFYLATLGPDSTVLDIVVALALSGLGLGISSPSIAAAVANSVEEGSLGIASATQQLMMQVGQVAGAQVMSTVREAREPASGLVGSFGDAYLVGAGVCLLGVLCAFFVRGGRASRQAEPGADGSGTGAVSARRVLPPPERFTR